MKYYSNGISSFGVIDESMAEESWIEITEEEFINNCERVKTILSYAEIVGEDGSLIEIVPNEYKDDVVKLAEALSDTTHVTNPYGISDETYNNIIDDYTSSITEEVANNGY